MTITQTNPPSATHALEVNNQAQTELEVFASQFARTQKVVILANGVKIDLLNEPHSFESILQNAYQYYSAIAEGEFAVSYAGEWLLDNFYIVQQALSQVAEDIPDHYYDELPKLAHAPFQGYPRIYYIAREITDWSFNPLDIEQINTFIEAYQKTTPLTMGELWALPAMLRAVNLENLASAVDISNKEVEQPEAKDENAPADETRVANAIINLRMLGVQDWKTYFESVSRVERILRHDPAGVYAKMDFETRNVYRHIIETLAPQSGERQEQAANAAIALAGLKLNGAGVTHERTTHVGYYLIDKGRRQLESEIGYQPKWREQLWNVKQRFPTAVYLGIILLLMVLLLSFVAVYAIPIETASWQTALVLVISVLPVSAASIQIVNWLISRVIRPMRLPKMDFSEGIPSGYRTMVVIPSLLSDKKEIDSLTQQLELHFLRNNDSSITFAILADYLDADQQHLSGDEELAEYARHCVKALNEQYGTDQRKPMYLFLRERRWNPSESVWMGWERKRGKLEEFNRLVFEPSAETSYVIQEGDLSVLPHIRYIITLDADTILPKDAASDLISTMAHPLNHAQFDEKGKVVAGYTILQPRIEISPTAANQTLFTRIFAGDVGIDLYTLAVSDVYQDWFSEGIFTGKGIYDVAAFKRSLEGRVPENTLLSHDLFEGIHGRAALVTDVILLEDYPPHYLIHTRRLHRWIRGDWQLLRWLMPYVPLVNGELAPNRLTPLGRWKILDNLRRSLIAPSMLILLVAGWIFLPGRALFWSVFVALISAAPFLTSLLNLVIANAKEGSWEGSVEQVRVNAQRWVLSLIFLPHEAVLSADAIVTTLNRLMKHKKLLQWTTTARTLRLFGGRLTYAFFWEQMYSTLVVVALVGLLIALIKPTAILAGAPLLALWAISPSIVYWLNRPVTPPVRKLSLEQKRELRMLARRTWLFFEQYVGPEEHWLPPDHYQESPRGIIAHHTSPTNIGLYLLSVLAAYDMGYSGLLELSASLKLSFESLGKLEKYRGHFLNWYDTRTLAPLPPSYVSTVDSGNLVGSLVALRHGLDMLGHQPIMRSESCLGLLDTLALLEDTLTSIKEFQEHPKFNDLNTRLLEVHDKVAEVRHDAWTRTTYFSRLEEQIWPEFAERLVEVIMIDQESLDMNQLSMLRVYAERVSHTLRNIRRDTMISLPWLPLLLDSPALFASDSLPVVINEEWQDLRALFTNIPNLDESLTIYGAGKRHTAQLSSQLADLNPQPASLQATLVWCDQFSRALDEAIVASQNMLGDFQILSQQIDAIIEDMDFTFLFDPQRKVFHIGYNVTNERLDNSFYDLFASEARLASLLTIATEQVPQEHWLHLGRPQTRVEGSQVLLSWSGTMFEYLMPMLLMQNYPGTLLDQSYMGVVNAHIHYGKQKETPWGISESGYYAFDLNQNYQYHAFGVPSVALKRGVASDLVIAPYASMLALPVNAQAVMHNLNDLKAAGAMGTYGLYEAIDYTPNRLVLGQKQALVREYMAHHQGMILLTLANVLLDSIMIRRFHSDPRIQSVEMLLQEQIPRKVDLQFPTPEIREHAHSDQPQINTASWTVPAISPNPKVHYLSNGRYGVFLTSTGAGYSQWQSFALTRWRGDTTLEDWGMWLYVQDAESGHKWSATHQPSKTKPDYQKVLFFPHKAEFQRRDDDIIMQVEVTVPSEDDMEIRRVRLTNHGDVVRRLRLVSYAEVVLASQDGDQRHPAFNKMFVESEYLPQVNGLLFKRRPRSENDAPVFMLHMVVTESAETAKVWYESDRLRFLGRNKTTVSPKMTGLDEGQPGLTGATLDPVMSLGQEITLQPHSSVQVAFITLAGDSRTKVFSLARTYQLWSTLDRAFDQVRYQSEREMRQLNIHSPDIERFQMLLSALFYPQPGMRGPQNVLMSNTKGQSGLWAFGISGDYPIIVVRVADESHVSLVRDLIQAHMYWRNRQIKITLVILNQHDTDYMQELYGQLHHLIVRMGSESWINRHDGIFLLRADRLNDTDQALLVSSARVYLDAANGTLPAQLEAANRQPLYLPAFTAFLPSSYYEQAEEVKRPDDLIFDNGIGGFTPDGREYVIYSRSDTPTPAPWMNVIANPDFGFSISEVGGGYTWAGNSSECRLTTWRNDPVSDQPAEALYLRDEETARVWSPLPLPSGLDTPYLVRHGKGYSTFEHDSFGLQQTTTMFVSTDAPIKIIRLKLANHSDRVRRITATYYAEFVLGTTKDITQQYIIPEFDSANQTLLFRNPYNMEFGRQHAFVSANKNFHGLTTDRTEFLGRLADYKHPAALERIGLSGTVQTGLDPCAAVQLHIDLQPGQSEEVYFLLGVGENREAALQLASQYRDAEEVDAAWKAVNSFWQQTTQNVTVKTPDPAMNVVLPWLLYQTLSCRVWGRSALYQSSGAFGFRDQLQDVMALMHVHPNIAREHILRAAHYQFEQGDVLHWWHPPSGRGVRTRCSDDLLFLPFVVSNYIFATGDDAILQEKISFLKGEPLKPGEDERYGYYESTDETFSIYEHCLRALNAGSTGGAHGLPLMGNGDWNDAMNRVGIHGKGESVWLGWFLYATLDKFTQICERLGEAQQASIYHQKMEALKNALESNAWDGRWYLRAFYDDGTKMGSVQNRECQIDSIAQSWAVISGAADPARAQEAMQAVSEQLVNAEGQLIHLFTPPFDKTEHNPGYIKGYPPGIRENGGQYTHAAIWTVWAFALLGDGDQAESLFRLLNPIYHADTPEKIQRYRVEPYVVAADVYSAPGKVGRGGWTWYTGSSGWMYRLGVEAILGLRREGDHLIVDPCIPRGWPGFEMTYHFGQAVYQIHVENPQGVSKGVLQVTLDDHPVTDLRVRLVDEDKIHTVVVVLGSP